MSRFVVLVMLLGSFAIGWLVVLLGEQSREPPNYSEIEPGLHMGGHVPKPPPGTRAVLNLCELEDNYGAEDYRWVAIGDAAPAPDLKWLRQRVEWVETQRREGRPTYIHCRNGISRSGMVVVAYLMKKNRWTRDEALTFVRSKRPGVSPNPAFAPLLQEWEREVKSSPAAP